MNYYKDGLSRRDVCHMEGHSGKGHCPDCGDVNYRLLGYYGAVARWAKEWGVTEDEAMDRIENNQIAREERADLARGQG